MGIGLLTIPHDDVIETSSNVVDLGAGPLMRLLDETDELGHDASQLSNIGVRH